MTGFLIGSLGCGIPAISGWILFGPDGVIVGDLLGLILVLSLLVWGLMEEVEYLESYR